MIRLLRRLSGAVLTLLGAATNTPTAAKQAASVQQPLPSTPITCGLDHELRATNLRRLAGEPTTSRPVTFAVGGLVEVARPGRTVPDTARDGVLSADAPADPTTGGEAA